MNISLFFIIIISLFILYSLQNCKLKPEKETF